MNGVGGKERSDSDYILNFEPMGFPDGMYVYPAKIDFYIVVVCVYVCLPV